MPRVPCLHREPKEDPKSYFVEDVDIEYLCVLLLRGESTKEQLKAYKLMMSMVVEFSHDMNRATRYQHIDLSTYEYVSNKSYA